jgi:dTDP-4-dehydrorhamnose reductase
MSHVLVIGAGGMLGGAMARRLPRAGLQVTAIDRRRFDILTNEIDALPLAGIDYVVNCAGLINCYQGDRPVEDFYLINSIFPRRLADACAQVGARLIHISTDCVFDGSPGPHDESARPSPHDLYGRSKLLGEPANAMVLRTSVIGPEQAHFRSLLCWFLSVEARCAGYTNHLWSGMTTVALADLVGRVIAAGRHRPGIFHLPGEDITKHELLRRIAQAFRHDVVIEPTAAAVPRDMRLRTRHPELTEGFALPPIAAQLAELAALCDTQGRWHEPAPVAAVG